MPVFAISDLHLADGGPRDLFAREGRPYAFQAFLDHVAAEKGRLVVLGDLFDAWQCNLSKAVMHYLPLLDRLAAIKTRYVPGNHDCDLAYWSAAGQLRHPFFKRMGPPFLETIGGVRYKFQHGHEADPYNAPDMPGMGRLLTILSAVLADRHAGNRSCEGWFVNVLEKLARFHRWFWGRKSRTVEQIDTLSQAVRRGECDAVVAGHTHQPGHAETHYYNCGCWCAEVDTFVRIEDDGTARVYQWSGSMPFFW